MMGMSNTSFYLSWYITYTIIYSLESLIISIIAKGYELYFRLIITDQDFGIILIMLLLFTQILIFLAFFVTVFFTTAKLGVIAGIVIFLGFYLCRLVKFF